ncbi:NAD(P)-binding domain-containing protein [Artemisia annua]|uniref:NAD(P)-binding domain-containing protein n=1 Tax=Artemisia annua TaxID=35608 RepID=A0A2U1KZF6_ARTAN|nr:NAD(P)-binding domain-containing protein [Artemisia annua]
MADEKTLVRFGILGCAEIARKVCRAITLSPNSTVYAISSRTIEKAKQFATNNNLPELVTIYGSYEEVLDDPYVDAVYVPLPTSLHLKWAVMAANKRKHVLLEKPTALNVGELDQILEACESNGVQFMDGSMWYHHPRTARMKEFLMDPNLFGEVKTIYSSSSFLPPPEFFENNIRTKADLDSLGALGDAGWYCIGAILWSMNYKLPTTVTALPATIRNTNGVIMSTTVAFYWEQEGTTATFYCSFLSHETMDVSVLGSKGSFHVEDLIIPYEETSAPYYFTSCASFADLHLGWSVAEQEVQVHNELPQEALMIQEFSRLVQEIKDSTITPDRRWGGISRASQVVLDAVKSSVDNGFKTLYL